MPTRKVLAVDLDVEVAVRAQRLVVLGDLEVLRHVRVEVVLPGEPAPARDLAVQGQADPDRVLDRRPVHHRQRAGQAQADRADLGVGFGAEGGRAGAEHLGPGAQLHVGLQADHRLVALHRLGERDQRVGHVMVYSPFASASSGWPQRLRERGLGRGGDPVEPVVGQRGRHHLQPDRQAVLVGQPARDRDGRVAGQVGRDRAQVGQVHRHRVVGALAERGTPWSAWTATPARRPGRRPRRSP